MFWKSSQISFVLYLTKKNIYFANYKSQPHRIIEFNWNGVDVSPVFEQIKKREKVNSAKIILGDDLSYVLTIPVEYGNLNRDYILSQAAGVIPENLTNNNFDWKVVGTVSKTGNNLVQVYAVPEKLLQGISYAGKSLQLEIYSIDAISFLLAAATKQLNTPHLILWSRQEKLAILCFSGTVYITRDLSKHGDISSEIVNLINFGQSRFNLKIANIILDWTSGELPTIPTGVSVIRKIIDPISEVVKKQKTTGGDLDVLEIKPIPNPTKLAL